MTGAHLGGRHAGRQRGNTAEIAPRGSAGVAAMVMGATTHGRSAAFFHQILIDVKVFFSLPNSCSWTKPNVSKPILAWMFFSVRWAGLNYACRGDSIVTHRLRINSSFSSMTQALRR